MFQFTTETLINSATDSNGVTPKFAGATGAFTVTRINRFKTSGIVGTKVYKRAYSAPVLAQSTIALPSSLTAGDIYRLHVEVILSHDADSEYARTSSVKMGRPIFVEAVVPATNTATALGDAIVANYNKQAKWGHQLITITNNAGTLTITALTEYQRFAEVKAEKLVLDSFNNEYFKDQSATVTVVKLGYEGFGTVTWVNKNLRLPTWVNTNWTAISQDERAVPGGQYTQYSFQYRADRGIMGANVVGASATSITTHIFYVLSTLVSDFETALTNAGLAIETANKLDITGTTSLANGATSQLTVVGAQGTVTWSVVSGTSATVNSSTGLVTAHASNDGDTVIKAVDALGSVGTITIKVA